MVAPPTSGQPHEVESDYTDPFSAEAPVTLSRRSAAPAQKGPVGEETSARTQRSEGSESTVPLTAHEQWILSQRPPHWG